MPPEPSLLLPHRPHLARPLRLPRVDAQPLPGRTLWQDEQVLGRVPAAAIADRQRLPPAGLPDDVPAGALPLGAGVQLGRAGRRAHPPQAHDHATERLAGVVQGEARPPKLAPMLDAFEKAIGEDLNTPVALTALEDVLAA